MDLRRSECADGAAARDPRQPDAAAEAATRALATALYRLRRRRDGAFAGQLFAEPTWDLLLDLFAAEKAGRRVSITSACLAAAAATTTALRCLSQLEIDGIVFREPDPADRRRTYVRLSADALGKMDRLLGELVACAGAAATAPRLPEDIGGCLDMVAA
jgi:hypothetical protein